MLQIKLLNKRYNSDLKIVYFSILKFKMWAGLIVYCYFCLNTEKIEV